MKSTLSTTLICFAFLLLPLQLRGETLLPGSLDGQWIITGQATVEGDSIVVRQEPGQRAAAELRLPLETIGGRMVRISGEFSGRDILPGEKFYEGGKVIFSFKYGEKPEWVDVPVPSGTFDFRPFDKVLYCKPNPTEAKFHIGFQNSAGTLTVRNLKIESLGIPLDHGKAANMELVDPTAGDGQGGWSDQGPDHDARNFARMFYENRFGNVPFRLIPKGKSVLSMRSKRFPAGLSEAKIEVLPKSRTGCLYLLHGLSGDLPEKSKAGSLLVTGTNGTEQRLDVVSGRDVRDWRNPRSLSNAVPVRRETNGKDDVVGIYLSRFPLDPALGEIDSVTFHAGDIEPVWIVVGATLLQDDLPLPEDGTFVVRPGKDWIPLQRVARNLRTVGSALDVSAYLPMEKAGAFGRVVIDADGRFVFEKKPDRPLRFFTSATEERFRSHADLDLHMKELRKNGYNMIRTHFLDSTLMDGAKHDLDFNETYLDLFDYMIHAMKENGIYLNFDCMTSWNGYSPGNIWGMKDRNLKKNSIHFDPAVRENWRQGVETILCRVNPYTKTRLIDDPVLVMTVGFNEQEFAFLRPFDESLVGPAWRDFLKKRYGSLDKLREAWGDRAKDCKSFEDIPCFRPGYSSSDNDVALFLRERETEMLEFYRAELRRMGFKGPVTNYNMVKNHHYNAVRGEADFVAMNSYHAHPWQRRVSQESSVKGAGQVLRNLASTRLAGKPLVVTEHNHVFWNRYRYEQGFVTGAYAAFLDFDGLTAHAGPFSLQDSFPIQSFRLGSDPIVVASEFLTFFAYVRGDVAPAGHFVRIPVDIGEVYRDPKARGGLSNEQSSLCLMTGLAVECVGEGRKTFPIRPNEIRMRRKGSSLIVTDGAGFSTTVDKGDDAAETVRFLKGKGILPETNRSDGISIYESDTGELLMDRSRNFLSVDTPRLQGVCAEAGTKAELTDFAVDEMSVRGNLAIVSVDGMKPIRESERMVLVYATNVLNSDMKFASPEMSLVLERGKLPMLLQAGKFRIAVRNHHADRLRLHVLDLGGNRQKTIPPERSNEGSAVFSVDTAQDGAAVFFEIEASNRL